MSRAHFVGGRGAAPRRGYRPAKMLSWVALHLAVAISALDGDESSRRELDINYSNQCKNLATKYGKKQRKRMKKYDRMHCPLE